MSFYKKEASLRDMKSHKEKPITTGLSLKLNLWGDHIRNRITSGKEDHNLFTIQIWIVFTFLEKAVLHQILS